MRLKPGFMSTTVGADMVLVPTDASGFNCIARGNKTFSAIVDLLRSETTEEEIVATLHKRYEAEEGAIEQGVSYVLTKLRDIGALEE